MGDKVAGGHGKKGIIFKILPLTKLNMNNPSCKLNENFFLKWIVGFSELGLPPTDAISQRPHACWIT